MSRAESHQSAPPGLTRSRIESEHFVVESTRGRRCPGYAVEIADVLPSLFNDLRAVPVPSSVMFGERKDDPRPLIDFLSLVSPPFE